MSKDSEQAAIAACEALCHAYGEHADKGEADALAQLYTPDGVFDRMGQILAGHEAIRGVISGRPPGLWTRHHGSNLRIEIDADGRGASGESDLLLERGRAGEEKVEQVRARYSDRFVLTEQGWKFSLRKVVVLS